MQPGIFILNGSGRAFQPADRGVGIDANHQPMAKVTGLGEIVDVPKMQEVEAAVGENDALALCLPMPHGFHQLVNGLNLGLDFFEEHENGIWMLERLAKLQLFYPKTTN